MKYQIRLATKKDCEELSKLKQRVWNTTYRGIYSDDKIDNFDYSKNATKFLNIIEDSDVELYVVEDNHKLIGYMDCGKPFRPYKNYEQEIGLLYILKEYQGQGIGKALFNLAYDRIKAKGYQEFFISCNKYNFSAQEFYKKMGGIIDAVDADQEDKSASQVKFIYMIK